MFPSRRDFLSLLAVPILAQDKPTYSVDVNVVNVLVTVRDKHGEIASRLTRDAFRLEEEGRPQVIRYFAAQTELPLTLGLLVDTSGSMRRLIGTERSASRQFFRQVLREDQDMAFVIHFDREVELLEDLTSSRSALEKALDQLGSGDEPQLQRRGSGGGGPGGGGGWGGRRGGTAMFDSVLLASDELMKKQKGRKALLLLSDGDDRGSKVTLREAIDSAQRADTLVYAIRYHDEESRPMPAGGRMGGGGRRGGMGRMPPPGAGRPGGSDGKKILQQIARETGGGYFEVSKKHPLDQIYAQIQGELRSQYNLGYTSDKPSTTPEYRRLKVTTSDKSLVVQARDGYYTH